MTNWLKTLIAYSFFVATSAFVAFNFFFIAILGEVVFKEPLVWLRILEFMFAIAVFIFAVERWISFLRRK